MLLPNGPDTCHEGIKKAPLSILCCFIYSSNNLSYFVLLLAMKAVHFLHCHLNLRMQKLLRSIYLKVCSVICKFILPCCIDPDILLFCLFLNQVADSVLL